MSMNDDRPQDYGRSRGYRSPFWPVILIGMGAVWLLSSLGFIPEANLDMLIRLWPLILIAIGLDLLLGRRLPALGTVLGLCVVLAVVAIGWYGPMLGLSSERETTLFGLPVLTGGDEGEVKTERFREPLGNATSAQVSLSLHSGKTTLSALGDPEQLIDAELTHTGEIAFKVSGGRRKVVSLSQAGSGRFGWSISRVTNELPWDIRLTPEIPLDLKIDGGSGRAELDLGELQLTSLEVDGGSGHIDLSLSAESERCKARISGGSGGFGMVIPEGGRADLNVDGGSGSLSMDIQDGATVDARIEGGSGSITVNVPSDAPLRVQVVEGGSGSVHLPSRLVRTSDGGDDDKDTGTWETRGFEDGDGAIVLVLDIASGSIRVR